MQKERPLALVEVLFVPPASEAAAAVDKDSNSKSDCPAVEAAVTAVAPPHTVAAAAAVAAEGKGVEHDVAGHVNLQMVNRILAGFGVRLKTTRTSTWMGRICYPSPRTASRLERAVDPSDVHPDVWEPFPY